jgi:phosphate/phosphite/phosphonate ABC transporter binding protein
LSGSDEKKPGETGRPLPLAPPGKAPVRKKPGARESVTQRARFVVQALVFSGFLAQGFLYYLVQFRPLGNVLPFMAYESLGHGVVSSALLVWAGLFLVTAVFGRLVCGWLCPIGFLQDAGERLLRAFKVPLPPPATQPRAVRVVLAAFVLGHYALLPLLASPVRVWQLDLHFREPWLLGFPFRAGLFAADLGLVFVVTGIVMPLVFGPRGYCKLVCETGLLLDLASRWSFGRIRRNEGFDRNTCIECSKCAKICPQGIDVFEEVHLFDRVVSGDCIGCFQCTNDCPNDTIVYSLRKRVTDVGRVAGYLATRQATLEDLPRHVLTGAGAIAGGYVGLIALPPSYFHTYLLLASLGGVVGWLLWRCVAALPGRALSPESLAAAARPQAERETSGDLPALTNKERMKAVPAVRRRGAELLGAGVSLAVIGTVILGIMHVVPPRIALLSDLSPARRRPEARETDRIVYLGVPPVLAQGELELAYGPLAGYLEHRLGERVSLVTAESYGSLAHALERGEVDAAILPPVPFAAVRRRVGGVVIAQVLASGRLAYEAEIVTRADGPATLEELRGQRVGFTSLDSLSGWIAPVRTLAEKGIDLSDLGEVVLAGNHSAALAALASGRVDAAATYDEALRRFSAEHPDARLRVLATIQGLPNEFVVARSGISSDLATALGGALLALESDAAALPVRAGLERVSGGGFAPVSSSSLAAADGWLR